jgi:hypothetical protein
MWWWWSWVNKLRVPANNVMMHCSYFFRHQQGKDPYCLLFAFICQTQHIKQCSCVSVCTGRNTSPSTTTLLLSRALVCTPCVFPWVNNNQSFYYFSKANLLFFTILKATSRKWDGFFFLILENKYKDIRKLKIWWAKYF